jgi:hypothetical protein
MSIEDPRVFNEPWCLECEANSPRSCKCETEEEVSFYSEDPNDHPLTRSETARLYRTNRDYIDDEPF